MAVDLAELAVAPGGELLVTVARAWVAFVVLGLPLGLYAHYRDRVWWDWALLGALLGPLAYLVYLLEYYVPHLGPDLTDVREPASED